MALLAVLQLPTTSQWNAVQLPIGMYIVNFIIIKTQSQLFIIMFYILPTVQCKILTAENFGEIALSEILTRKTLTNAHYKLHLRILKHQYYN